MVAKCFDRLEAGGTQSGISAGEQASDAADDRGEEGRLRFKTGMERRTRRKKPPGGLSS
jgi:hypothetical protein